MTLKTVVAIEVSLDALLRVRLHDQSVRGYLMERLSQEAQKRGLVHRNEFDSMQFVNVSFGLRDGYIVVEGALMEKERPHGHL